MTKTHEAEFETKYLKVNVMVMKSCRYCDMYFQELT